jgi:hypothetical protein
VGLVRLRASQRLVECVAAAPDHLDTCLAATLLGQFLCVEIQARRSSFSEHVLSTAHSPTAHGKRMDSNAVSRARHVRR